MQAVVGDATAEGQQGFERFFRAQYPVVVRVARGVLRDQDLAEDVAQDVMIAARRRFPEPEGSEHAAAWVRTAAAHLALNVIRGHRRREERHRRVRTELPGPGPEEILVERETGDEVRDALSRLPLRPAMVLVLRHSGLSYAEVAAALGVQVGAVGTMLRRAEAALAKEMERHAPRH